MQTHATPLADAFAAAIRAAFPAERLEIRFAYNGSGDDGWFDDYIVKFLSKLPAGQDCALIEIGGWYSDYVLSGKCQASGGGTLPMPTIEKCRIIKEIEQRHSLDSIYRELGDILEKRHPGWEINDGGCGAFMFRPDGTRVHGHSTHVMETIDEEDTF